VFEAQAGELLQAADEMADFICAEIDQRSGAGCPFLPLAVTAVAAALSLRRITARKASASIARVMCRYQPCRDSTYAVTQNEPFFSVFLEATMKAHVAARVAGRHSHEYSIIVARMLKLAP
jgi:hypothetical protein